MTLIELFLLERDIAARKKHTRNRSHHRFMLRHGRVSKNVVRRKGFKRVHGRFVRITRKEQDNRRAAAAANAMRRRVYQKQISRKAAATYHAKSKRNIH